MILSSALDILGREPNWLSLILQHLQGCPHTPSGSYAARHSVEGKHSMSMELCLLGSDQLPSCLQQWKMASFRPWEGMAYQKSSTTWMTSCCWVQDSLISARKHFILLSLWALASHKVEGPLTSLPFLDTLIDTERGALNLPAVKIERLKTLIHQWKGKHLHQVRVVVVLHWPLESCMSGG